MLTPVWRKDDVLDKAALLYDEASFDDLLAKHQEKSAWEAASATALTTAAICSWEHALAPLGEIIS